MELNINLDTFKSTFGIKENPDNLRNYTFSGHKPGTKLKLFPFDAHPGSAEVVKDLNNVVGGFIRQVQKEKISSFTYDDFIHNIKDKIKFPSGKDEAAFDSIVKAVFFNSENQFEPTNIGTYKFIACKTKEEKIASYLCDTLCAGYNVNALITDAIQNSKYHVLEKFVMSFITSSAVLDEDDNHYKVVVTKIQKVFYDDLCYLLQNENFAKEYFADFLEHYYFFYTSQACLLLNKFFTGEKATTTPLYYSIDWEKTSKSRPCYYDGWQKLQKYLPTLFSHAVTLEILNQNEDSEKLDYIDIRNIIAEHPKKDEAYATQIMEATSLYRACIHDCDMALANVHLKRAETKTEQSIRFLFDSVMTQFENSSTRSRANSAYTEKFELFCKTKILKNRKTMGLMLNLTDRNLLFLSKICLKNEKRMRLNDVFNAFERRGVYLDTSSKVVVMNYYEKLNLIEKKSDSGDAQYVKGIL